MCKPPKKTHPKLQSETKFKTIYFFQKSKLNLSHPYLSVKVSIFGLILLNEVIDPFNRNNLIELSKLSKNSPKFSYLQQKNPLNKSTKNSKFPKT